MEYQRQMNLSFRQLQAFREVMRTGSVSDAARILGRTQPAISALVANLEAELGIALFRRQRGKMAPTPEAQYFITEAEAILDRLSLSTRTMREIGALTRGRLNIACMPAAASLLMPQILGEFLLDKPDVKASLMMRASPVIEEWVASQQYDIGLGETPKPSAAIETIDFDMRCVCAIPAGAPLRWHSWTQSTPGICQAARWLGCRTDIRIWWPPNEPSPVKRPVSNNGSNSGHSTRL